MSRSSLTPAKTTIGPDQVQAAYEMNPDTNRFTNDHKRRVEASIEGSENVPTFGEVGSLILVHWKNESDGIYIGEVFNGSDLRGQVGLPQTQTDTPPMGRPMPFIDWHGQWRAMMPYRVPAADLANGHRPAVMFQKISADEV